MLVEDLMQRQVITVMPCTPLPEALRLSRTRGVRHLPVLEEGKLVGIISDRDLKRATAWPATALERHELAYLLEKVPVEEIMTRAVIAAEGRLVGIVTETDVLDLFVRAMGAGEPSSRLDVVLPEGSASLAEVVHAIEGAEASISSIVTLPGRTGRREVVVRVRTINPGPAIKRLEARGFAVRNPWRG